MCALLFFTGASLAKAELTDIKGVVSDPKITISRIDGQIIATITGTLDSKGVKLYNDTNVLRPIYALYQKRDVNTKNSAWSDRDEAVRDPIRCNLDPDTPPEEIGGLSFICTVPNLTYGTYVFDVGILFSSFSDSYSVLNNNFIIENVTDVPYKSGVDASVSITPNTDSSVSVTGYLNTPAKESSKALNIIYGEVFTFDIPNQKRTQIKGYQADVLTKEPVVVHKSENPPSYNAIFTPPGPGTYVLAVVDSSGALLSSYKQFTVVGTGINPDSDNGIGPNALGCVNEKDNKSYCLLAPLPGVGDTTGKLDVSTGIGNYFNMIIKLVMGIIGVLAVLMVVVGGIEYMSTVNLGEKEGARARITSAILGLLLALGAFLILKTINPDLVNVNIGVPKGVIVEGDPGDDIDESDAKIANSGAITPGVVVPTGTAQELAKQILNSSKITLATESWNGGPSATARQNILDTINGQGAVTSTRGSKGGARVPLQTSVLAGAIAVSNVTPIQINAFVNGRHDSSLSRHYIGAAMDIQSAPSEIQRTKTILGACKAAGATEFLGPCNNNLSKKICDATGFPTNSGHQTHIHCGWPR